ncbi:MAG TPA: BrnA antitoxin family protein [Gammaproteobacteria bacterium]|jgi:uncharacterized protein (DUF4415 family)|nr:BrnA antitoxin family protein [Gammaproteobacteria bacterium]
MKEKSIKKGSSRTNLKKLRNKNDRDIDYSDIPATTKEFWKVAEAFMPQNKIHISLRLDEDIVDYFKEDGDGYQSRINAVLKAYMLAHPHKRK